MTGGIFLHTMSDHYPYFVSCNLFANHSTMKRPKYIKKRVNDKLAYVSLLTDFCRSDIVNDMITDPYTDPNINYEILENHVTRLKNKHLPLKTVKLKKHKHRGSKWISRGVIRSIKYRDKLYRELKRTDRSSRDYPELQIQLKTYNSLLKCTIKEAKQLYFNEQFNKNRSDVRKTWGTISEIIQKTKNKPSGIKSVLSEGKRISDPADIAEKFNNFFIRMSSTLADKIKRPVGIHYRQFLHQDILSSFKFDLIDEKKITHVARCLHNKSSSGKDGISLKLLKYLLPGLSKPLTLIINQSLLTGIFPDRLKIAKVIPLYKKGDESILDNYRPTSLLPAFSKIFEKIVHEQLTDYFTRYKLFFDGQYGFRKKHSTELVTIELVDRILSDIDNKPLPVVVFMDLSKAFDTLDHSILIHKLQYYGITGIALNWFKSYLSNRLQYVDINGSISSMQHITTGVPQGSILGPLLFLIYMNDLPNVSALFKYILFADDTSLLSSIEYSIPINDTNTNELMNIELCNICNWLAVNKLSVNVTKTKFMVFHPHQKDVKDQIPNLKINDSEIELVENFNFLGIQLDKNLNWKTHTNLIANKLSKYSGILNRLKRYLPLFVLRMLYFCLVNSQISYGLLSWGFQCKRLEKLQKRIIRIKTCSKYNAHTDPLFKRVNVLKINDVFKLNALTFYYKYTNNELPSYFGSFQLTRQGSGHPYDTRHGDQFGQREPA